MTTARSLRWRKATHSGPEADCIELAHTLSALRDSKNPAVMLTADVRRLVDMVRSRQLGR